MEEKRCTKCGQVKLVSEFYSHWNNQRNKTYLSSQCKDCFKIYNQSEKGRLRTKRFAKSEKGKAIRRRYCQSEKGKASRKRNRQSENSKEAQRRWNKSKKGKERLKRYYLKNKRNLSFRAIKSAASLRYIHTQKGQESLRRNRPLYEQRYPERRKARTAVMHAVERGDIPPAKELDCAHCGQPALEYHHFLGYERNHWLDVIPLCHPCHTEADLKD